MQTATGGFAGSTAPYCVLPILRERLGAPCDTGRTRSELLRCFPEMAKWEGMAELPEVWWSTETEWDLLQRVDDLKAWLRARPEQTIAVVGHGGLFTRIIGYHLKNVRSPPHRARMRPARATPRAADTRVPADSQCGFEWYNLDLD